MLFEFNIKNAKVPGADQPMDIILAVQDLTFSKKGDQASGDCNFEMRLPGDGQIVVSKGVVGVPCSPGFLSLLEKAVLSNAQGMLS